ncbi:MAG: hypothetical protein KGJ09_03470 [Candidatus Omnitrophica bacterium]|nr:hypothetical protein [Candidatus Omnitrophota bacterium]
MFPVYDFVLFLYALLYLPYLLVTGRGYAGFSMRLGRFSPEVRRHIKQNANIWVHAVSVGEVMLIDAILFRLRQLYPAYQFIVTVTTRTGYQLALERLKDKALVVPSPVDFGFTAARFVELIDPKLYIAVETEIWPNLYRKLHLNATPTMVINGRISDASFDRYKLVRIFLKPILNYIRLWCMQTRADADRIIKLGAEPSCVCVTGNIKFDELPKPADASVWQLGQGLSWWVAGSTHPGEEEMVISVYSKLVKFYPRWRLIIVPRHIERTPQIMELIVRRGLKAVKFKEVASSAPPSRIGLSLNDGKAVVPSDTVVVVDTIGQLRSLYSLASLVFVGKSLCVGGGQNVIEPASYGKAVIIGPLVQNFRDIVACFKEHDAIVQVEGKEAFEKAVLALCADEDRRRMLGAAAKEVIAANQGATQRSLERLRTLLK